MVMPIRREADPARLVPFNFRIPEWLVAALDTWVADENGGDNAPINRSDLIRGVLSWAAENRPEWRPQGRFVLELQDGRGRTLARRRTNERTGAEATFIVDGKTRVGKAGGVAMGEDGEPVVLYLLE